MQLHMTKTFSNKHALARSLLSLCCGVMIALSACSSEPQEPAYIVASEFRSLSFHDQLAFAKAHAELDPAYEIFAIRVIDMSMDAAYEYTIEYEYMHAETGKLGRLRLVKQKERDEIHSSFFDDFGKHMDDSSLRFYLGNLGNLYTRKKEIAKIQINPLDLYDHYQAEQALQLRAFSEGKTANKSIF